MQKSKIVAASRRAASRNPGVAYVASQVARESDRQRGDARHDRTTTALDAIAARCGMKLTFLSVTNAQPVEEPARPAKAELKRSQGTPPAKY